MGLSFGVYVLTIESPRQQIICCYLHRLNMYNWQRKWLPMTYPLSKRINETKNDDDDNNDNNKK